MGQSHDQTGEVRKASGSGDFERMLRALELPADAIARHFLLLVLVETSYSQRHDDPQMRELCCTLARQHIEEFPEIAEAFRSDSSGLPPMVPTFQHLATVLAEDGSFDEAVEVCEHAISYGLIDGTKSGFEGRIARIRKQQKACRETGVKPKPRRRQRKPSPEEERARRSKVPRFQEYYPTTEAMNAHQRRFYDNWRQAWEAGTKLPVDGNISYLFCYLYRVFRRGSTDRGGAGKVHKSAIPYLITELTKLIKAYCDTEPKFASYCREWLSDCYVVKGDYRKALVFYPLPSLGGRSSVSTDRRLSLKLAVGERIDGHDLVTLVGLQVTKWGREHLSAICRRLEDGVKEYEIKHGVGLLDVWARDAHSYPYSVFAGSLFSSALSLKAYEFSGHAEAKSLIRELTRDAENAVREEFGKPPVKHRGRS
ncbi:MAG: TerB N-terminal domain-containing protein [Phycisphaerae bacterium]